jgi:hypothetical protein
MIFAYKAFRPFGRLEFWATLGLLAEVTVGLLGGRPGVFSGMIWQAARHESTA